MNTESLKEYAKIGAIAAGIALSSSSLIAQNADSASTDVRLNAVEQSLSYMQAWRDKTETKIEVTAHDVSTLNVQLAQVLVKIDNVIECLKDLKNQKK